MYIYFYNNRVHCYDFIKNAIKIYITLSNNKTALTGNPVGLCYSIQNLCKNLNVFNYI